MTLRSYVVNYLDPDFVREEELALLIERKLQGNGISVDKPLNAKRVYQSGNFTTGGTVTLTVPGGKAWTNIDIYGLMEWGGVSPSLATFIDLVPRESEIPVGPYFYHVPITTQAATNDVTYFFASQNAEEYRSMDHTGVGGQIYNIIAIPKILLTEDWAIRLTNQGGAGDVIYYLIYYTEVDV